MKPAPIGGLPAPIRPKHSDEETEYGLRALHEPIVKLQQLPSSSLRVIGTVKLVDGVITPIAHGLGRRPVMIIVSPPRGAAATGRIMDYQDSAHDYTKVVVLQAAGWGATVEVEVAVM